MVLDFLARRPYFLDHLLPIWEALSPAERGTFYVADNMMEIAAGRGIETEKNQPYRDDPTKEDCGDCGHNHILTCAYGDAVRAANFDNKRKVILMEHGIGLTFGRGAYADGLGQRKKIDFFPVPNEHTKNKCHPELKDKPHPIVGMPKLDKWAGEFSKPHPMTDKPVIGIAFHHGDKNTGPRETGSAWEHYIDALPELSKKYNLLLHIHPMANPYYVYGELINQAEFTKDFNEVMHRADIFIGDCGSAPYEFLVTGKPVILLNAPWFDKKKTYGLRFWDYTNIGIQVEHSSGLDAAIQRTIENPGEYELARRQAVHDLFPYLGKSTERTIEVIRGFLGTAGAVRGVNESKAAQKIEWPPKIQTDLSNGNPTKKIRTGLERGIIYIAFGTNAWNELGKSIKSLRATGCDLPVTVVGNSIPGFVLDEKTYIPSINFIEWAGESPFNKDEHRANFRFQAAIVKSALYEISPYMESMYVDCDTEFLQNPEIGFNHLLNWDMAIAIEPQSLNQLYNEPNPRHWIHDIPERDLTVQEMGGDGNFPMINSGVFFWRKNEFVKALFLQWYTEWLRFKFWDEQKALLRALETIPVRMFLLSAGWNTNVREQAVMIYHKFGQCDARSEK